MDTQVIFKIDKKIKDAAMAKARREGVPLGLFLKHAMSAFADDTINLDIRLTEERAVDHAISIYNTEKRRSGLKKLRSLRSLG